MLDVIRTDPSLYVVNLLGDKHSKEKGELYKDEIEVVHRKPRQNK